MNRMLLSWLIILAGGGLALSQEATVWVASPWQHVLRSTAAGDVRSVEISAACNEYEPFRVIVRAGAQPLQDVVVEAGSLTGTGGEIDARNIALFREHYIHITAPSRASKAPTGWYPDALIPCAVENPSAPPQPAPWQVAPHTNQGIWADVYVPRGTPAGDYCGPLRITANGAPLGSVTVTLRVQPFTLPDQLALRSNFGSLGSRLARQWGMDPASGAFQEIEDRYIDLLLAHRAIPSSLGNIWPQWTPEGGIDDSQSGERLRAMVEQRQVNSLCVPFAYRDDPEKCRAYLRDMADYLRGKGWLDLAYIYMEDEPNDAEQYETVRQQGALIRESGIKRLCTEQTVTSNPAWGTLYGAVDIWCPLWCLYDESTARERQRLGEEIWTYTALCQGKGTAPFWQIDFDPVHFRAPFWVSWHYDVKGFLYWSSIYGVPDQDPWVAPHFRNQYWGEGMLLYPGLQVGLQGPVASIRLKLIREALEDFEYMTLASQQGRAAEVDKIVAGVVASFNDWSRNEQDYLTARAKLAALIADRGDTAR